MNTTMYIVAIGAIVFAMLVVWFTTLRKFSLRWLMISNTFGCILLGVIGFSLLRDLVIPPILLGWLLTMWAIKKHSKHAD